MRMKGLWWRGRGHAREVKPLRIGDSAWSAKQDSIHAQERLTSTDPSNKR